MILLLPFAPLRPDINQRLTRDFLASGGKQDKVFRWEAATESSCVLRDHLGHVCDVPSVAAGCVFNDPELGQIIFSSHINGYEGVLLRGASALDGFIEATVSVIFADRRCIKNRVGLTGSLAEFLATPALQEVAS